MDYYWFVATISLALQLTVLALLLGGFAFKRRMKYRQHGIVMLAALVIHIITIIVVMVPSLVLALITIALKNPTSFIGLLTPFHAAPGIVTLILSVWIVGSWRLRQSTKFCAPNSKLMLATFILWIITLIMGIIF